jgi:cytochrome c oxidase subunit 2
VKLAEIVAFSLIVLVLFGTPAAALGGQRYLNTAPDEFTIVAHTDEDGGFIPSRITVVQGEHVRLRLTSADVIHGLAVPGLGINVDEIYPGKYVTVDFTPTKPGTYPFMCTVVCSPLHYKMQGAIIVVPSNGAAVASEAEPVQSSASSGMAMQMPEAPRAAVTVTAAQSSSSPSATAAVQQTSIEPTAVAQAAVTASAKPAAAENSAEVAAGKETFQTNCAACHGADAAGGIKLGSATSADLRWNSLDKMYHGDQALIRRAILSGKDEDGEDLNPVMPRWQGKLSDAQVNAIIAYLQTLDSGR